MMNGRVSDAQTGTAVPFTLYAGRPQPDANVDPKLFVKPSTLNDLFFSPMNVNALQDGIRYRVFVESQGRFVVGRQSDVELGIVMRSIMLQEGKNKDEDVVEQVRVLNGMVLDYCVPLVLREAGSYLVYRRDVATLPEPISRGEMVTSKGTRSLEMPSFF